MPTLNYFCFAGVLLLALNSSNNSYTPRAIFEAPFLTEKECSNVISMFNSNVSGSRNELILHDKYSKDINSYLEKHLNGRLGPLLERVSRKGQEQLIYNRYGNLTLVHFIFEIDFWCHHSFNVSNRSEFLFSFLYSKLLSFPNNESDLFY